MLDDLAVPAYRLSDGSSAHFRQRRRSRNCGLAANMSGGNGWAVRRIAKLHPEGRMVAGALSSADVAIAVGALQALCQRGAQQNVEERRPPSRSQQFRM
jgi:hypothetical protein